MVCHRFGTHLSLVYCLTVFPLLCWERAVKPCHLTISLLGKGHFFLLLEIGRRVLEAMKMGENMGWGRGIVHLLHKVSDPV